MLRGAVIAAGPGVLIGAGLAIAVVPGGASSAGWPLAGLVIAAALAGPPLIAVWLHRRPAPASNPARITTAETRRPARPWRRPVAEVTAVAASVAGLVVLREQGVPTGGGTDLYLTVTPVLVAIPVVVVMLRLYPLAIRGLLALSARRAGATGFVALSRAARSSLSGALPAFALVLSLSVATFAGMVSQGITGGEITASWHTTGADVLITPAPGGAISPDDVQAIAAVPGVRHAALIWNTNWFTQFGQPVEVAAVDPAAYRAVVAGTPFSAFPAAVIGKAAPQRGTTLRRHRAGAGLARRRRRPRHGGGPAQHAVRDGPDQGAGRGHPGQHPGGARGRGVRGHAAADPARTGRRARAEHAPGHRLLDQPRPAYRGGQPGDTRQRRHVPRRGAGLAGQFAAAARRRPHHHAHHRGRRRVRLVHRDPGPGARRWRSAG